MGVAQFYGTQNPDDVMKGKGKALAGICLSYFCDWGMIRFWFVVSVWLLFGFFLVIIRFCWGLQKQEKMSYETFSLIGWGSQLHIVARKWDNKIIIRFVLALFKPLLGGIKHRQQ